MLFRRIGTFEKWLTQENRMLKQPYNMHFHLNFDSLRKNDASVNVKDITVTDEYFVKMDHPQMEVLMEKRFFPYIAAKTSC